jgi:hypothetical protein
LLDQDEDALAFSASHLPRIDVRLSLVCANVVRGAPRRGPTRAIRSRGRWSPVRLSADRVAIGVLRQSRSRLLRAGGQLLFTNISAGNAYQPWIEYMADWFPIHRSADDVRALCGAAGLSDTATTNELDRAGVTLIVKCQQF